MEFLSHRHVVIRYNVTKPRCYKAKTPQSQSRNAAAPQRHGATIPHDRRHPTPQSSRIKIPRRRHIISVHVNKTTEPYKHNVTKLQSPQVSTPASQNRITTRTQYCTATKSQSHKGSVTELNATTPRPYTIMSHIARVPQSPEVPQSSRTNATQYHSQIDETAEPQTSHNHSFTQKRLQHPIPPMWYQAFELF